MKNKDRIKRLETLVDTLISMQIELDLVHQVRERLEPALGQMDLSGIVAKPTDSLKMEEKPQPIEGVEFDCEGDKVYGVCKDELSLYYSGTNNLWAVLGGYTVNKPCHLVPVEKYTVGRVYKYRGEKGDEPEDYFLCIDYHEESKICTAINWSVDKYSPLNTQSVSAIEILEVQTI